MTRMARRALAVLAPFGFAACVLDFENLSGGTRGAVDGGGEAGTVADAMVSEGGSEAGSDTGPGDTCPGTHGPESVRVTAGSTSFCIDATEVTNGQYAEFLATNPTTNTIAACNGNTFVPSGDWPGEATLPVDYVDWCDAYAFCEWAGKRLCGRIGAQHLDIASRNDPSQSQWFFACSANGTKPYPYGATFTQSACIVGSSRASVGSKTTCEGGFAGVLDMSGSLEEWTDECTQNFSDCISRGGSYTDSMGFECETKNDRTTPRATQEAWRGFRCCSP